MAALTTMLVAAAAVGSTAMQVAEQKKAEKQAAAASRAQQIKAEEAAKLKGIKQQDVRVKVGSDAEGAATDPTTSNKKGVSTANTNVDKRVGRILQGSASNIGGL